MRAIETLYFDFGNTRAKWSFDGSGAHGVADYNQFEVEVAKLAATTNVGKRIVISSVMAPPRTAQAVQTLKSHFNRPVYQCRVAEEALGVRCGYPEPKHLGVDRWLAVLAVWSQFDEAALVVDLGTAATFDILDRSGAHKGGFIVSGVQLAVTGLLAGTDNIKNSMQPGWSPGVEFGRSTTGAVWNGALRSLVAMIKDVYAQVVKENSRAKLVLTGGDADTVGPLLGLEYELLEGLVFKGMAALDEQELTHIL